MTASSGVSSGAEQTARRLDAVEHRIDTAIGRYAPYAGLAIGLALTPPFLAGGPTWPWVVIGALVPVTATWCAVFTAGSTPRAERPVAGAVYMGGLLVLMTALVHASPLFAFQVLAVYIHAFTFLHGRWRFVAVVIGAAIVSYSQVGGRFAEFTPGLGAAVGVLTVANALLGGGGTYFGVFMSEQNQRRREIIDELGATNRRLSEALDENASLHAQLLAQAREAGMLDERARLAREIHDTIAQGLTGIVTQLEAAGVADGDPAVRRRHIETARALARESLTEARRSVDALGPRQLVEAQLPDAIADMAKRWAEGSGVELILDTTGDPRPLLPELEVTLFRVAQEALANVAKHADAGRVGLTLSYMDDVVVLDVRDDGRGFVSGARDGSGFGLLAMEQRVRRVAGTFSVESAPGEGVALSASVPAIPAEVR
ncbi:signal transduction histidine kinase [Pseudonocardia hierapolitana]|uniref:Oxygen sensor histidine kinase NreB n=1 Tax=Pseudonocardia hierapolitana TaxID=1128676 RepID=A0A561SHW2_9PSEU|nr:sensor histidine kinase [Pseudonocardia hierapolitana]TWF74402.1 signal transduction histidine kinase [Pseudonocardia hierapolitana]